jgi:hypothetical protein
MVVGCGFGADHDLAGATARIRGINGLDNPRVTHSYDPDRLHQSPPATFADSPYHLTSLGDYRFSNIYNGFRRIRKIHWSILGSPDLPQRKCPYRVRTEGRLVVNNANGVPRIPSTELRVTAWPGLA